MAIYTPYCILNPAAAPGEADSLTGSSSSSLSLLPRHLIFISQTGRGYLAVYTVKKVCEPILSSKTRVIVGLPRCNTFLSFFYFPTPHSSSEFLLMLASDARARAVNCYGKRSKVLLEPPLLPKRTAAAEDHKSFMPNKNYADKSGNRI